MERIRKIPLRHAFEIRQGLPLQLNSNNYQSCKCAVVFANHCRTHIFPVLCMPNENPANLASEPVLVRCRHRAAPTPHGAPIELRAEDFKQKP
jgi:hypothetical protein